MRLARKIPEGPPGDGAMVEATQLATSHATGDVGLDRVQVNFLHCVDHATFCMQCHGVDEDGEDLAFELWVNPHDGKVLRTYFT